MRLSEPMKYEAFVNFVSRMNLSDNLDYEFLYQLYETAVFSIEEFGKLHELLEAKIINHVAVIYYLVSEYLYSTQGKTTEEITKVKDDEKYLSILISNIVDKYLTNSHFDYQKGQGLSEYYPPISSLTLYLNFVLGMLKRFPRNEPQTTLMNDVMTKAFTIAKSIIDLLKAGFETEAFATWRTLHETEAVLKVLNENGADVQKSYLLHMKYALAFRQGLTSKEETDAVFVEIKSDMAKHNLKSKDMKRFIEYGWLFALPFFNLDDYKLNFRNGLQDAAGLKDYSRWYEMSSEVAHSSPVLIYATKDYFGRVSLLNLFESFFRLEKIFGEFFMERITEGEKNNYLIMHKIHYNQLVQMYINERDNFFKTLEEQQYKKN